MVRCYSLILLLATFIVGCRPASPTPTATSALATPTKPEVVSTKAPTSPDAVLLRNAKYQLGNSDALADIVQLKDGKFQRGAPGDANYASIQLTDFVASGELNPDHPKNEIAALFAENYGGSGVFVYLAVFSNENGTPTFIASTLVEDRPQINSLTIKNNRILLDGVIHSLDDPMCCPTLHITRSYRLVDDQLDITNYATFTPDGKPRTITIGAPADRTEVFNSFHVQGKVAVVPFENNLTYSLKDSTGVELSRGAVPVTANPNGGGTFDATISLGSIISSTVVYLEIQDVSAADGTLLAMDSVELVVK